MFWVLALSLTLVGAPGPKKKRYIRHKACVVQLQPSVSIKVRNPKRAYGTKSTVETFERAVRSFAKKFPGNVVRVGDMSWLGGGRMPPHASHKRGWDIDVGYFRAAHAAVPYFFFHTNSKTVDPKRTWALVRELLATGRVEYIFMARNIQRALYKRALATGTTKAQLVDVFQYPRNSWIRQGTIRWSKGHDTHFHVRFLPGRPPVNRR
jgi:murein endopeptidase